MYFKYAIEKKEAVSKVRDTASFIFLFFYVTKPRLSQARALSCPRFFVSLDIALNVWQSYNLNTTIKHKGSFFLLFWVKKSPKRTMYAF